MGTVDKCDMVLNIIESVRKTTKWYKKETFFHLLDKPQTLQRGRFRFFFILECHFFSVYQKENKFRNSKSVRERVVCKKHCKRSESRYECTICNVKFCVTPCFELYHTKKYS